MIGIFTNAVKGFAIGAANVVPGVSGGTMALILGIYERLLNSVKSVDTAAVKLLLKFRLKEFIAKTDLVFLGAIMLGVLVSFLSLAKVLKWGFENYPLYIWSIFFGLILASIIPILKSVKHWKAPSLIALFIGLVSAASMAFLTPAAENTNVFYLMLCGVVAMASMIIPGLSGSFVLLLMGNYKLIMLDAVSALSDREFGAAFQVLIPVGVGAVVGVIVLSRVLSWLFKRYHDTAISLIGGFVAGSLAVIWPWKDAKVEAFTKESGELKEKIVGFENWRLPDLSGSVDWIAIAFVVGGIALLMMTEFLGRKNKSNSAK